MSLPGTANLRCFFYLLIVAALILALVNDLILAADLFSFEKKGACRNKNPPKPCDRVDLRSRMRSQCVSCL